MSEQTPNSSEDLNGAEPSMEDILASIRKIISEDEPVALESPEDVQPAALVGSNISNEPISDLTSDAVYEATGRDAEMSFATRESVDLNIDEVLADLDDEALSLGSSITDTPAEVEAFALDDLEISNMVAAPSALSAVEGLKPASDAVSFDDNIFESDDDILDFLDADIPLTDDAPSVGQAFETPSPTFQASEAVVSQPEIAAETVISTDDVEMDALLDEILMTPEDEIEDFAPEASFETELDPAEMMAEEEQSDLDLVKSLMADLADDPGEFDADSFETEEDLDSLLAIPDVEEMAVADIDAEGVANETYAEPDVPEEELMAADLADPEEDILGDILDMTLEDELSAQPDDLDLDELTSLDEVQAAEQDNILENEAVFDTIDETPNFTDDISAEYDEPADDLPSLSEIAAAAEADAVAVETSASPMPSAALGLAAAGAGLAAVTAKAEVETTDIHIDDVESASVEPAAAIETITETPSQSLPSQETEMPVKAVNTDTILDDVTESAAAGAFAQLNTVVEDKAIFNERGPRIGDLVQEALRPMLKEWLDANLKGIVERAVTKEVKRISSGK